MVSPYNEHAASGLPNPTHLEGVRFVQAQDKQVITTHSLRIVTGCFLTRAMSIKRYILHDIYSRFRAGAILSIIKYMYEYDFITTVTIEFDDSSES